MKPPYRLLFGFVSAGWLLALSALTLPAATVYVWQTSPNPAPPFADWATAAQTIQDAVDAAAAGDTVLVTNGVYASGGGSVYGSNRVAIVKPLTVLSVNGPAATLIVGTQGPGGFLSDGSFRCAYVGTNAVLSGFTLTNGWTRSSGNRWEAMVGGGAWCEPSGVVTNCILIRNVAWGGAGGAFSGTLNNCSLSGNGVSEPTGVGGGARSSTLNDCLLSSNSAPDRGGGAIYSTLNNCTLTGNRADWGGGAWGSTVNNCVLSSNLANYFGGGTDAGILNSCSLMGNGAGRGGGGAYTSSLTNCSLSGNRGGYGGGASGGNLNHCTLTGNSATNGGGSYSGRLNNCTLSGNSASLKGGGAYSSTLSNCVLNSNSADEGGGSYSGNLSNSSLTGNSASSGGGAAAAILNNCTLTVNSANSGGGVIYGFLTNCIVYFNMAPIGPNYQGSEPAYCCTTPLPGGGVGNIEADPLLASPTHLSIQSPCIGRGSSASSSGVDIDGEAWLNPPCMGADQLVAGQASGPLTIGMLTNHINVRVGFAASFEAQIDGRLVGSAWDFGDGVVVSNRPYVNHAWAAAGGYGLRLIGYNESYPGGISGTVLVQVAAQEVYYVNGTNRSPTYPYTNWSGAATNIQDAIDAGTQVGRLILVGDGSYGSGGRTLAGFPLVTNRVVVAEGAQVRSMNGPAATIITGAAAPGGGNGDGAVRCAYLGNNCLLSGFTLTNGHTRVEGDNIRERGGGGVSCEPSGVVTNCLLTGNSASYFGGGAYSGTLNNCTAIGNSAYRGGGASGSTLDNCSLSGNSTTTLGGGAFWCVAKNSTLKDNSAQQGGGAFESNLKNCILSGNWASSIGGGSSGGNLNNCTLIGNRAGNYGGGTAAGILNSCSLMGNSATNFGGAAVTAKLNNCTLIGNSANSSGGADSCYLTNCIVFYNMATIGSNHDRSQFAYSCTTPLPPGSGNVTNEPGFVSLSSGNLRLQTNSACINAGNNAYAAGPVDLDGRPRIVSGVVDMGAYEFQGAGMGEFIGWLQQFGQATDGTADSTDPDHDGLNNWQEWVANTQPTNGSSFFRLESISNGPPAAVRFNSSLNRLYTLKSCTNLAAPIWFDVGGQIRVPGNGGPLSLVDTNALPLRFYRVGVSLP